MGTILKHSFTKNKLFNSISVQVFVFCCLFAAVTTFTLVFALYTGVKTAAYSQKKIELSAVASDFLESLSARENPLFSDHSSSTYTKRRLLITDETFKITYDSSTIDNLSGKILFLPATVDAMSGETFFDFLILSDSLESTLAIPLSDDGKTKGALILLESDFSLHYIFGAISTTSILCSLVIIFLFFALSFIVSYLLKSRITNLLTLMKKSRTDSDSKKIPITINDEFSPVIDELNHTYEELNYVQQMRQAFVSDASHELRTPLAAIRLLCESITGTENIDTETTREFLEDIILEVDRMSHTAEKLLVLSKLDNFSSSRLSPVPLTDIVKKTIIALSPIAQDKSITIESYLDEDCTVIADMEGVTQIVANLIDNAIKYNKIGGILRIYLYTKNDNCVFITDDTGIGIAEEYREHVFERFYRVDKSRKHDGRGGSGLGLAIVKRNVESFGGSIKISDSVYGGTRFTTILPRLVTEENDE